MRDTPPHAAFADQGGDFIRAEARAWAEGHGFQSVCEGDYKPGRGLLREVHAAEEGLEAGVGAEGIRVWESPGEMSGPLSSR